METVKKQPPFCVGQRVRWNYWTDNRDSGWIFGTVVDGPIRMNGILCYLIDQAGRGKRGPFPGWRPASLIESAEDNQS